MRYFLFRNEFVHQHYYLTVVVVHLFIANKESEIVHPLKNLKNKLAFQYKLITQQDTWAITTSSSTSLSKAQ